MTPEFFAGIITAIAVYALTMIISSMMVIAYRAFKKN